MPREVDPKTTLGANYEVAKAGILLARSVLDSIGATWWLEGGTLLGVVREHDLVAHDDDLDIDIPGDTSLGQIQMAMVSVGFKVLKSDFIYQGDQYGLSLAVPGTPSPWTAHLDIWKQYIDGDKMFLPTMKGPWSHGVPKYTKMVFPRITGIIRVPFLGQSFPIPENYDAILTAAYGDWSKPDPNYSYVDSKNYE